VKNFIKNFKYLTAILLLTLIIGAFVCPQTQAANADAVVQKQKQTRAKINHLKWLESVESNKLYKNQQKLENTTNSLANNRNKLEKSRSELSVMEGQLAVAMSEFSAVDFRLKSRIRKVYKSQRKGFFMLLLSAKDFNTFLDRIYFENIILQQDYKRMVVARDKAKHIAQLKYNIEMNKRNIERSIQDMKYQQKTIQRAITQNESMIVKLRTNRVAYEKAEKELAKQSASIGAMINKTSQGTDVKIVSGFLKPISGRITSPFGYRTHPIFNSRTFHSGIDIGGPYRGSIKASNSGKVIYSGWYGGYGKVVIVDHGNVNGKPTTTLYAHMDSISVSNGQYVSKGQVIGYEGTTGYSTGPHVHFEVRVNGQPNNPQNYI